MELTDKDVRRMALILLILVLGVFVFFIIRPVFLSVIGGLILAYILLPIYRLLNKYIKHKGVSAGIVSILLLAFILIPLWFFTPLIIQQLFDFSQFIRSIDIPGITRSIFPTASEQFVGQVTTTIDSGTANFSSLTLNSLVNIILNFPTVALHLFLLSFVFFFTLRDEEKLREFVSELSPFNKVQERVLVNQFKNITQSIVYGQVLVGLLQGLLAGLGFLIFGVENVLILTMLAIVLSIIPIIGPGIVYFPVFIYMLLAVNPLIAIGFLIYNMVLVSSIDNILRAHIVSRSTGHSQVIILIGMIGGLLVFGVLGLILGPLILAYFVTFLRTYKERNISSLFAQQEPD